MLPPRLAADDPRLATRHLLALPDDVAADEVEALAVSRFLGARWDTPVPATAPRGRAARDPLAGVGVLRLSRHSSAAGPFALAPDDAARLGLPPGAATAYLISAPRERGEPPYPGGDRDGLKRAFPDGMPVRDEERVLRWLVDAARRLGGAVRVADGAAVLAPDPAGATDLTVYSAVRLEPGAALAVVQRVVPGARLAMDAVPWTGPRPDALPVDAPVPAIGERVRRRVQERAAAWDAEALAAPDPLDGYGIEVVQDADGVVVVEAGSDAGGVAVLPVALRGLTWPADGVATYRVRWEPADDEEAEQENPPAAHRAARDRAQPVVAAVARALYAAVGGEVMDAAEFLVEPVDL
ncbi:hypothetical protein [Cellulomonas sp. ATA003]|uniref:hypothetical protein n=1 Tax=Cellulomonas sp. ATA003 TaxID=3073064 RepID=UPI002872D496|nr:hypothetical protein [Cellulomonas sp. ATA003]WNB85742.1 hypothetical protein REH70_19965 [Cellulomonas sp. ATA003]